MPYFVALRLSQLVVLWRQAMESPTLGEIFAVRYVTLREGGVTLLGIGKATLYLELGK